MGVFDLFSLFWGGGSKIVIFTVCRGVILVFFGPYFGPAGGGCQTVILRRWEGRNISLSGIIVSYCAILQIAIDITIFFLQG